MSTFAAARVETKIILQGEGNAAKAVKETRDQLDGMGSSAGKATDAATSGFAKYATVAQQSITKIGGAVSATNAVLGGTNPILQKIGQGFTAAGAVANIIPGPIGLAAAAVTGLAVATYKFVAAISEADVKSKFMLGGAGSEGLADRLGVTQDAVLAITQGMSDLSERGLRPTEAELRAVRDRAEAMGQDGSKAVEKFVAALNKGPEALRELQKELGDLGIGNLESLGESIGLSKATLGLEKESNDAKAKSAELLERAAAIRARIKLNGGATLADDQRELTTIAKQGMALEEKTAAQRKFATEQKAADTASTLAKGRIQLLDIEASTRKNKDQALGLTLLAIEARIADVKDRQAVIDANRKGLTLDEINLKTQALQIEQAQLEAQAKQAKAAAEAEKKAKAQQAAARGKAMRDAEVEAQLRLNRAQVDSLTTTTKLGDADQAVHLRRLQLLDAEEKAQVRAAKQRTTTAAGREADLTAIAVEFKNKRDQLDQQFTAAESERLQRVAELRRELSGVEAEKAAAEELDQIRKDQTAKDIEAARARGDFKAATLLEIEQAEAAHAAAVLKINQDLELALTGIDEQGDEARAARALADAKLQSAAQKLAEESAQSYAKQSAATAEGIDKQIGSIEKITGAALAAGGLGDFGKGLAGIATNVQKGSLALDDFNAAAKAGNVDAMAKANEGLSTAIDGTIAASGAAAAAFVDDEKTKAAILAITETAASIASFASGNVPAGIAHGVSAGIYAGIAGGAIPSGGAGTATAATGGATTGGGGAVTGTTGGGAGAGGGVTQVFNFNKGFVIGSTQEVAKGISGTLRSVNGTGYDRRKAA